MVLYNSRILINSLSHSCCWIIVMEELVKGISPKERKSLKKALQMVEMPPLAGKAIKGNLLLPKTVSV